MSNPAATAREVNKYGDPRIVEEIEKDKLVELETGMSGEQKQLPGRPKEYSGWDVYNNEAKEVDTELVNDWRDSLNSLLLFAAIFAAVLTAFLIESKKLLESDPSEAMLEVMIFFTNNLANGTFTSYPRSRFEPESPSVTINCLFLASLSASLVAALASVVALQRVADYDAAIARGGSSPEDRAKRRQFRYAGIVRWKMSEIIAALPLLLYTSVVLFFSGLTLWMWIIHHTVGAVVAGGMGISVLFYGVTTLLSVASVSAPFRTPLSRLIYSSVYLFFSIVDSLSRFLPIPSSQAWLKDRHQKYTGSVKRDDGEVNRRHWLGVDALSWLASHLSISLDSYDRLLLLVNELRKQDQKHFITSRFKEAPWFSIFDLLAWQNFNTAGQDQDIRNEEMRAVAILAHCYRVPAIYAIICPKAEIVYHWDDTLDEYWSQCCDIIRAQWSPLSPSTSLNSLFLLLRDIPLPSNDTAKQIEFTIRLSRWRNSHKPLQDSPEAEISPANSPSTSVVVVGRFLTADEEDLWFTRDARSLYQAAAGRMVELYVKSKDMMAPSVLDTLRWRFESLLLGHVMDTIPCLSRPLLYRKALEEQKTEERKTKYSSLHGDFTLLLARNLKSFSGTELTRRVHEVLTMMWISSGALPPSNTIGRRGLEAFFEANKDILNTWVHKLDVIPRSLEILEHLSLAQAKQPAIGSLWRTVDSKNARSDLLMALLGFRNLIRKGVSPAQHAILIGLLCRDIELSPLGAFKGSLDGQGQWLMDKHTDPCLKLIGTLAAGVEIEFPDDTSSLEASWIRTAKHLMEHYEDTDSPTILKLQASAWFLAPEYTQDLCWRALRKPQTLTRVKRIFEYTVECHEKYHGIGQGHLLLHLLPNVPIFTFPPALTEFPLKGPSLNPLLGVLILSDGYEKLLRQQINKQNVDKQCTNELLEMVRVLGSSQYSMLATLSSMGYGRYPDDLAVFSICVNKALNLPEDHDHEAIPLIRSLLSYLQLVGTQLRGGSVSEQEISRREATKMIERLHTYLAPLLISGTTNCRVLSCARAPGAFSPATGWLAPYTD